MDGAIYFVTWRLAQSQPRLDEEERTIIANALRFFDGQRYLLYSFVVMDDHVHAIVQPQTSYRLEQLLKSWKGFTATSLLKATGRTMPLWQTEYYDRIIRDARELDEKVQYVLDNPFRRWGKADSYEWCGLGQGSSSDTGGYRDPRHRGD